MFNDITTARLFELLDSDLASASENCLEWEDSAWHAMRDVLAEIRQRTIADASDLGLSTTD